MMFLAGAATSGIIDLISSLKQNDSGKHKSETSAESMFGWPATQSTSTSTTDTGTSTTAASSSISPGTMRMLLWLQSQGIDVSSGIFSALDADGSGGVSKSEFEQIFAKNGDTAKADALFAKLDSDSDGSVSTQELADGLRAGRHHGPPDVTSSNASGSGDSSQTVSNADGSTTTTITYTDGTQVTMTRPAASTTSAATSLLERLIQRQADMLTRAQSGQTLAKAA